MFRLQEVCRWTRKAHISRGGDVGRGAGTEIRCREESGNVVPPPLRGVNCSPSITALGGFNVVYRSPDAKEDRRTNFRWS